MLRANAPVFIPGAPRFPVVAAPSTPKLPEPLENILRIVLQLPVSARAAALGPMLDALGAGREVELGLVLEDAQATGDKRLALDELSEELRARKDALTSSSLTHRELLDALCASLPRHNKESLALAALLLPADFRAQILKSHASISRGLIAGSSAQAAAETIARAMKKTGEDRPMLLQQFEHTLAELPSLEQAHPQAMRFLAQQAYRLQEESTLICQAPRAALERVGEASAEDVAPLLDLHDAIRALCRTEGPRLEATTARALLDHATESLGTLVLAYRNLENYCKALGLNDPTHLPADLIAASRLDASGRKKKLRDLIRNLPQTTQAALTGQLLDRNLKPSAQLKTLLSKIRAHGKDPEKALATVFESLQQQLASLARTPNKDAQASEDALLEEAIKVAQREKERAASTASVAPAHNPNREKLRAALRAQRGNARDPNNLSLLRAEERMRRQAEQRKSNHPQTQHGETAGNAIEDLRSRNLDIENPAALEKHIQGISEFDLMKLLTDTEKLAIAVAEGIEKKIFPPEVQAKSQSMQRIFVVAKRLAHAAQAKVTLEEARTRLRVSFDRLNAQAQIILPEHMTQDDLMDALTVCLPIGATWARTIDLHRKTPLPNPANPDDLHIDWYTAMQTYLIIRDQIEGIPELGEDILLAWTHTHHLYLDAIGIKGDSTLTPSNSRLLERLAFEEAEALASRLGTRLRLLGQMPVNAAITHATTMSRLKAQSESLTSPGAFSAWCLMDALLQAEWDENQQRARILGFSPDRPDTPNPVAPTLAAPSESGSDPNSPSEAGRTAPKTP